MTKKSTTTWPTPTGAGLRAKVIGVLVAIAVLTIVVRHPGEAASMARTVARAGEAVIDGIVTFIRQFA